MSADFGILVLRVLFGGAIAAHGAQKLFGWFGGYGPSGTGSFLEGLGFHPGRLFAILAGLGEFGGGVLLVAGFLTPLAAMAVLVTMLVAMATVHRENGFFVMTNGIEAPFLYAAAAMGIAFLGGGASSLDAWLGTGSWSPPVVAGGIVLAVVAALITLGMRHRGAPEATATRG